MLPVSGCCSISVFAWQGFKVIKGAIVHKLLGINELRRYTILLIALPAAHWHIFSNDITHCCKLEVCILDCNKSHVIAAPGSHKYWNDACLNALTLFFFTSVVELAFKHVMLFSHPLFSQQSHYFTAGKGASFRPCVLHPNVLQETGHASVTMSNKPFCPQMRLSEVTWA